MISANKFNLARGSLKNDTTTNGCKNLKCIQEEFGVDYYAKEAFEIRNEASNLQL